MHSSSDSLESIYNRTEIENRVHSDFWAAFVAWEEAPAEQKAQAYLRLNNKVRQLYDFMVRPKTCGRLPYNVPENRVGFRPASQHAPPVLIVPVQ